MVPDDEDMFEDEVIQKGHALIKQESYSKIKP